MSSRPRVAIAVGVGLIALSGCVAATAMGSFPGSGATRIVQAEPAPLGIEQFFGPPPGDNTFFSPRVARTLPMAPTRERPVLPATVGPVVTVRPASMAVGQRSEHGTGSYVLWIKAENTVYLVSGGIVERVMPTTDNDEKTPVGDYQVTNKEPVAVSLDEVRPWTLNYFVAFHRRAGATGDIGLHMVPVRDGQYYQSLDTVGQAGLVSDGCARLLPQDARAAYAFARVGTTVKVR